MKLLYLDTETTGVDPKLNGLSQVAGIIIIDGVEKGRFSILMRPDASKLVDAEAIQVQGITLEELNSRQPQDVAFQQFQAVLSTYVDRYAKADKFHLIGYNVKFDEEFIRQWFKDNGDNYFGSWFWTPSIDVMSIAALSLIRERPAMKDFKLGTVAAHLGLKAEGKLHDAMVDIDLTRRIMQKVAPEFIRRDS